MESFTGKVPLHWTLSKDLKAKEGSAFQRKGTAKMKARTIGEQLVWGTTTKLGYHIASPLCPCEDRQRDLPSFHSTFNHTFIQDFVSKRDGMVW